MEPLLGGWRQGWAAAPSEECPRLLSLAYHSCGLEGEGARGGGKGREMERGRGETWEEI